MKEKPLSISIFFPFLNDWGTVGSLVLSAITTVEPLTEEYEVIIVDDGSDESAKEMLRRIDRKFPKVRVVAHEKNRGYGGALRTGFEEAKYDWIFYTDCDAQYDVRELRLFLDKIGTEVDVVQGYKIKRADPWYRTLLGRIYHHTAATAFGLKIRDVDCDFRLMRRSIFDKVQLTENSGVICVEMIKKIQDAGFKFVEVPVHHFWRTSGKSQFFNFRRLYRVWRDLTKLWFKLVWQKRFKKTDTS